MEASPEFDAPIPGMGMTAELGGRPWQSPPQYPTVEKAIEYYIERITTADFKSQLLDVLEMGVTVTAIVNTIQLSSVMEGIHTIDNAVIVSPHLYDIIIALADSFDVEYNTEKIVTAIRHQLDQGKYRPGDIYGKPGASKLIGDELATCDLSIKKSLNYL